MKTKFLIIKIQEEAKKNSILNKRNNRFKKTSQIIKWNLLLLKTFPLTKLWFLRRNKSLIKKLCREISTDTKQIIKQMKTTAYKTIIHLLLNKTSTWILKLWNMFKINMKKLKIKRKIQRIFLINKLNKMANLKLRIVTKISKPIK